MRVTLTMLMTTTTIRLTPGCNERLTTKIGGDRLLMMTLGYDAAADVQVDAQMIMPKLCDP